MTSEETGNKHHNAAVGKKQKDNEPKDATALNKTLKAACKLRNRATHKTSSRKHMKAPPLSSDGDLNERNETEDSNVLKNLSNKDTSAQPTVPNLRLRQTLRKASGTTMAARKVISSSLLKRKNKARHKFKKKQVKVNTDVPKRRGRPPKLKKPVHDENTSTGQNSETVIEKTTLQNDPKNPAQLSSPSPKAAVASDVSAGTKEQEVNKTTKTSVNESKCKKSVNKQIKKSHVSSNPSISRTSADKTRKSTTDKVKKVHKAKKRSSPESGCQSAASNSSESKKRKVTKSKVDTKTESDLKETPEVISAVQQVEATAVVVDEEGKATTENKDSTHNCTGESVPAAASNDLANTPSTTSGETKEEKPTKPHLTKKERPKENKTKTASSGSDKVKKNQKDVNKKTDKKTVKEKRPRKDPSKTPAVKKKSKSVVQPEDGAKAAAAASEKSDQNEEGKVKEEGSDPTLPSSGSSVPADTSSSNEKTSPTATEGNSQKVTTQKKLKKNSDPNKESKKRKSVPKEGHTKSVKKPKGDRVPSAKTSKTEVKPFTEGKAAVEEGTASLETPPCPISSSGYSVINRKGPGQVVKSSVCKDTLAMYGKKPYMRLPPTAYLDEKYITMPKRRKDMSPLEPTQRSPPPGLASVTAAQPRQRCANCFATFTSAEELQGHLQLQRCSNLFGFDSDDEGNS